MKWLLLITLSLYSFIVQSAPCGLTNVGEQRGTYILKPLSTDESPNDFYQNH